LIIYFLILQKFITFATALRKKKDNWNDIFDNYVEENAKCYKFNPQKSMVTNQIIYLANKILYFIQFFYLSLKNVDRIGGDFESSEGCFR
jgi:hypothetical protein